MPAKHLYHQPLPSFCNNLGSVTHFMSESIALLNTIKCAQNTVNIKLPISGTGLKCIF